MSLFGSLYVGASGLQTSQNALNTTAHNMTNTDTTGYVRQQTLLESRHYITTSKDSKAISYKQYGLGVQYAAARQVRDFFLDKTYRRESGRSMFYEVSVETLDEVEILLGEMNGEDFQTSLTNLWKAIEELSKDPSSSVTQGLLVQRAAEFLNRANAVYDDLCAYQNSMNEQIKGQVDQINKYGKMILELNSQISKIEASGIERANDLRDTRNQILDELSKMAKISYSENIYGQVSVQIEGTDFVKGTTCYEIGLYTDANTGFYTPFWPQDATYTILADGTKQYNIDNAEVFNLNQIISSGLDTDIGGLKAMLLARGDHRSNYSDILTDYDSISQSIVMNVMAEFDQLIHHVATEINKVLADAYNPETGYMCDKDGSPLQLFKKVTTDGWVKTNVGGDEVWTYMEEDPENTDTMYSLGNLRINANLQQEPSMLGFKLDEDSVDYDTAEKLKEAFSKEAFNLNPNVQKKTTLVGYYTDLVSQVGNTGSVFKSIYTNQQSEVSAVCNAREQVIGVSTDEELSNMIKFQNAYNAASRYINVISEMMEHIINTLAM